MSKTHAAIAQCGILFRPDNLQQILRFASCPSAYSNLFHRFPRFPCNMQLLLLCRVQGDAPDSPIYPVLQLF